jgi:hypothetical protein
MARGVGGQSPSNVQSYLAGLSYPAKKQDLLATAKGNGAPGEVIEIIQDLDDEEYGGPQEVMKAYGRERRQDN